MSPTQPPAVGVRHQTGLNMQYLPGRDLLPAEYNPRLLRPAKRARLKESLRAHGFVDPAIARAEDLLLIGGHQRVDVWVNDLKGDLVPVVLLTGVSDAQAKAMNIALNNPDLMGEFDMSKLKSLAIELDGLDGFDFSALTGLDDTAIVNIVNWSPPQLVPDTKPAPEPQLKSERLIEIRGSDQALTDLMEDIGRWAERPGVTITIT